MEISIPSLNFVAFEKFIESENDITIYAYTTQVEVKCPKCQHPTEKIHSSYIRYPRDLPITGKPVRIQLQTRKLFCENLDCPVKIFCERLPESLEKYAHRRIRLNRTLTWIALAAGGELGSRLSCKLGYTVSATTLIKRIRSTTHQESTINNVRVLGVDDFAFRKRQNYGTILVDQQKHKPIDLLADRESETLKTWLEKHPEIEIITRDRAFAYAKGSTEGAPQAIQIADRFHLLQNLQTAVERMLTRNQAILVSIARNTETDQNIQNQDISSVEDAISDTGSSVKTKTERPKEKAYARRKNRFNEIKDLKRQGLSIRQIAHRTGMHRVTIRKYINAESVPIYNRSLQSHSKIDSYTEFLQHRLNEGCRNAAILYREIRVIGFKGCEDIVRRWLRVQKQSRSGIYKYQGQVKTFRIPSPRTVSWWLLKHKNELKQEELDYIQKLTQQHPEIQITQTMAKEFQRIVRERQESDFDLWLKTVRINQIPEIKNFANGLMSDEKAVRQALKSEWSNGQVDGQVNKLKMIKRTMYGRAKLDLLKARVLNAI